MAGAHRPAGAARKPRTSPRPSPTPGARGPTGQGGQGSPGGPAPGAARGAWAGRGVALPGSFLSRWELAAAAAAPGEGSGARGWGARGRGGGREAGGRGSGHHGRQGVHQRAGPVGRAAERV